MSRRMLFWLPLLLVLPLLVSCSEEPPPAPVAPAPQFVRKWTKMPPDEEQVVLFVDVSYLNSRRDPKKPPDKQKLVLHLWPAQAPKTIAAFKKLASANGYKGAHFKNMDDYTLILSFPQNEGKPFPSEPEKADGKTEELVQPGKWSVCVAKGRAPEVAVQEIYFTRTAEEWIADNYLVIGHCVEGPGYLSRMESQAVDNHLDPPVPVVESKVKKTPKYAPRPTSTRGVIPGTK